MIRSGGGVVVNVASVAGLRGSPGQASYAASKGGVIALTRTLARELAGAESASTPSPRALRRRHGAANGSPRPGRPYGMASHGPARALRRARERGGLPRLRRGQLHHGSNDRRRRRDDRMIAWLVAGQGAEHAGMGLELARSYRPAATLWERASEAAGKDLLRVSEVGGRSLLAHRRPSAGAHRRRPERGFLPPGRGRRAIARAWTFGRGDRSARTRRVISASRTPAISRRCADAPWRRRRALRRVAWQRSAASKRRRDEVVESAASAGAIFDAGQVTADAHLGCCRSQCVYEPPRRRPGVSPLPVSGPWHSPLMQNPPSLSSDRSPRRSPEDARGKITWLSNETAEPGATDAKRGRRARCFPSSPDRCGFTARSNISSA